MTMSSNEKEALISRDGDTGIFKCEWKDDAWFQRSFTVGSLEYALSQYHTLLSSVLYDKAQIASFWRLPKLPVPLPHDLKVSLDIDQVFITALEAANFLLWLTYRFPAAVVIAEPETISPLPVPIGEDHMSTTQSQSPKRHRASSFGRRLHFRASITPSTSLTSLAGSPKTSSQPDPVTELEHQASQDPHNLHARLISSLIKWLYEEKARRSGNQRVQDPSIASATRVSSPGTSGQSPGDGFTFTDADTSLDRLEKIVKEHVALAKSTVSRSGTEHPPSYFPARKPSNKKTRKLSMIGGSSDTEYQDGDTVVPSVDVILDNSKTMGYSGGVADTGPDVPSLSKRAAREKEGWLQFKNEIVRLAHTLRLKGWRRVPLDRGADIEVQRLSGALTNAVYVVSPPKNLPNTPAVHHSTPSMIKRPPSKLLLRVYGPQVEHLIDRETELQILRRLARKKIGPRLLGTFENGRFEEYFNATTLTAKDLRNAETSKQIAKRMRELHDGIELLEAERDSGPFVWQNWDKWVARCEEVISWLDTQIIAHEGPVRLSSEAWKTRGFVCGVEWFKFRKAVENYRKWLEEHCGGSQRIRSKLVFAHNDTQYGNLLRLQPSGESPLLIPANEHKQLVVIDFEYANANTAGLEFANHFTEWCYNYHTPKNPHFCNTGAYPTPTEQRRFISAYIQHAPQYGMPTPTTHPSPGPGSTSTISSFMLDSRGPPAQYDTEEKAREDRVQREIEHLTKETRLWRVANSAQWVAWGIVQAKVDGMDKALEEARKHKQVQPSKEIQQVAKNSYKEDIDNEQKGKQDTMVMEKSAEPISNGNVGTNVGTNVDKGNRSNIPVVDQTHIPHEHDIDDDPEFDYLAYAQQRSLFFWGDLLEMGLIQAEELPESVRRDAKRVPY